MSDSRSPGGSQALDAQAALLYARWLRAVDMLWRETVLRRLSQGEDSRRAERRARNLRKIVRKALSKYHRIELERQRRDSSIG
jgi:hypothetical protein